MVVPGSGAAGGGVAGWSPGCVPGWAGGRPIGVGSDKASNGAGATLSSSAPKAAAPTAARADLLNREAVIRDRDLHCAGLQRWFPEREEHGQASGANQKQHYQNHHQLTHAFDLPSGDRPFVPMKSATYARFESAADGV